MKIYTRGGDRGKTSLFSGERVPKNHARVEAYGDVDELSSVLGAAAAVMPETESELILEIQGIQSDLMCVGGLLAATSDASAKATDKIDKMTEEKTKKLESAIDRMDAELPALRSFILPGGHISAAWAHVARTVCRRAERHIIALSDESDKLPEHIGEALVYVNRLSDYLFVLARYCNHISEEGLRVKG
ncbi:MAG: ATP:cob(I)alamin adenosyltransferase [Desulfobacteraceae bacterium 4572_88]|nr:MAG: ATP:cob(I)alamin adenosyltransferase [Desulfobacteraceae bacterium 4572_88]